MTWTEHVSKQLRERYFQAIHASGLPIYVFPKPMAGTYAILAVRYGSLDACCSVAGSDPISVPDGIAHFLEHKMFENDDGSDSFANFSAYGADANAYTTYQRTAYLFSTTEHFEQSLEELLRMVTHPYFTEASIQKERGIIAEEIRMYEDHPWERCYRGLLRALYAKHPIRNGICGSEASISEITPSMLYECHRLFYCPSNMVLIVCGNVDPSRVQGCVDSAFSQRERSDPPQTVQRILPQEPNGPSVHRVEERMQLAKPVFSIGIRDPFVSNDCKQRLRRDAVMAILNEVLFSRCESFYNTLFEKGLLTPAFSYGYSIGDSFAFNCISGESEDPDAVYSEFWEYLERITQTGISEPVFERCRRVLYADEIRAYDSTEEIAENLLTHVMEGTELFDYPNLLLEVTVEDANALLRQLFCKEQSVLSVIFPLNTADDKEP